MTPLQHFLKRLEPSFCARHVDQFLNHSDLNQNFSTLCYERPALLNLLVVGLREKNNLHFGKHSWWDFSKYLRREGADIVVYCFDRFTFALAKIDEYHECSLLYGDDGEVYLYEQM